MRCGDNFVINLEEMNCDFKGQWTDPNIFPAEIFDWNEWRKEENYMRIVKDEENHDLMGNKKLYSMHPDFTMVIL